MTNLEAELEISRTEFFKICIYQSNISLMKEAYKRYCKASDDVYMPVIKQLKERK
jgi:hypothetical protein